MKATTSERGHWAKRAWRWAGKQTRRRASSGRSSRSQLRRPYVPDYEQAERLYAEGLSLARELDSAYARFLFLQNWGWTALLEGDPERATVLVEEAVELARERRRGFMGLLSRPLDNLGWAALLGGELGRAKAQ